MTEQYQTPGDDDTQGHVRREDDAADTADDTQGHVRREADGDTGDDDVQGHVRH